jgi:hypothetical protein
MHSVVMVLILKVILCAAGFTIRRIPAKNLEIGQALGDGLAYAIFATPVCPHVAFASSHP